MWQINNLVVSHAHYTCQHAGANVVQPHEKWTLVTSRGKSQASNGSNKKKAEVKKKVRFKHAINAAVANHMDEESKMDTAQIDSYIATIQG